VTLQKPQEALQERCQKLSIWKGAWHRKGEIVWGKASGIL